MNRTFYFQSKKYNEKSGVFAIFILSFVILLSSLTYLNNYYNISIKNKIQNRVLNVHFEEYSENELIIESYKNHFETSKYINGIYDSYEDLLFKENSKVYEVNYYSEFNKISNIEAIVPKSLNKDVGDYINLEVGNQILKLEIISEYNDEKVGFNKIIVSENIMQMYALKNANEFKVIIDDYDNIEKFNSLLEKEGLSMYMNDSSGITDIELFTNIINYVKLGILVVSTFLIFIIGFIISFMINEYKYDIAILKTSGFRNIAIIKLVIEALLKKITKLYLIINVLVMCIYCMIFIIFEDIQIYFSLINLISSLIISYITLVTILLLISYIGYKKILKISPIKLFKSE